jgi:carboxypeptidase D
MLLGLLLFVVAALAVSPAQAVRVGPEAAGAFSDRYPVEIPVGNIEQVRTLEKFDIDVDGVTLADGPDRPGTVSAYVNETERAALQSFGYTVIPVPNQAKEMWEQVYRQWEAEGALDPATVKRNKSGYRWDRWYSHAELSAELQQFAADNPTLVQLINIGNSVQGRAIWFVKISDNVTIEENEPEFKFSSTIHGDEVTGMELTRRMMHYLVDNYSTDPSVANLVNSAELWFCPLHNPDGMTNGTRENANGYNLNREFPDPVDDPNDSPTGRPIEVQHMMNFQYPRNFVLGANYHGGELVMNLPWDCRAALAPDDALFWQLGTGYSILNPPMYANNTPPFVHGVTNGAAWYIVHGGLQDWAYNWRNELHFTIEVSTTKWPAWSQMETFWNQNRDSMLWYMNRVIATGVKGVVTNTVTGQPLEADVNVTQVNKIIKSDLQVGDYHRLLMPGTYTMTFTKSGYETLTLTGVVVIDGQMTVRNAGLQPSATYALTGAVTAVDTGAPLTATVEARRHDNGQLIGTTPTDPATGHYSLTLASSVYDVKAIASGYMPLTQPVTLTGPAVLDFQLVPAGGVILVVTDGATTRIGSDLAALGYSVVSETAASTTPATWPGYNLLVWSAGANESPVAQAALRTAIESYVAAGGKLLIEGGEIGYDACSSPSYPTFRDNVLHVTQWRVDNAGALARYTPTHPIATTPNELPASFSVTYAAYGDEDAVVPAATATSVYRTTSPGSPVCGGVLAYDDDANPATGQIVYFSFNYNALADQASERLLLQNAVEWLIGTDSTDVLPTDSTAARLWLAPAPNPLDRTVSSMRLTFDLVQAGPVSLAIYDVAGRTVRVLLAATPRPAGRGQHETWDGRDAGGRAVGAGTYWVRLAVGNETASRRVTVVR